MVSANSPMSLSDLGDLTVPNPAWLPLIFRYEEEEAYKILKMPLLIAQVTFFACGGFSLGIRLCHCICDGFGAMQFLGSWAATAKTGELVTDPEPVWDREIFKDSLSKTTRLVQEARVRVSEDYLRSTVDYVEVKRPKKLEFGGPGLICKRARISVGVNRFTLDRLT